MTGEHDDESQAERRRRDRRSRRVFAVVVVALVVIIGGTTALVWPHVSGWFSSDPACPGPKSGTVTVVVQPGDGASVIGQRLCDAGVVASIDDFLQAAADNPASTGIQPGTYSLPVHVDGKTAVRDLLDSAFKVRGVVVPEGVTVLDIEKRLADKPCTPKSPANSTCGIGADPAAVKAALRDVAALGIPTDFLLKGRQPASAEGFLYPLTYSYPSGTTPADALQEMVLKFSEAVRQSGFSSDAQAVHLTPYQALIVASIAQSEAYFPSDMPKVARVILNRIAAGKPLQFDSTSSYGAKLQGLDPRKVIYKDLTGPYNTYTHKGLPPTPIDNPGADALQAAVHPSTGTVDGDNAKDILYFVNKDKAGHLVFFDESQAGAGGPFDRAVAKCRQQGWGCG